MLVRLLMCLLNININKQGMSKETEEESITNEDSYNYEKLGEYIHQVRHKFGISVKQLCEDCHISRRTYYVCSSW